MPHAALPSPLMLWDDAQDLDWLYPFTATRSISQLRGGIYTQAERAERLSGAAVQYQSTSTLQSGNGLPSPQDLSGRVLIRSSVILTEELLTQINRLATGTTLRQGQDWLACHLPDDLEGTEIETLIPQLKSIDYQGSTTLLIDRPWKFFLQAKATLEVDFDLITKGRNSEAIADPHTRVYNPERIFLEMGVKIRAVILSAEDGPIYIGKNAQVQEGAMLHGTMCLLEGATANMGAKLRGDNIIGPYCKVGGEVANSVLMGYSNKGHDGYLGNSVLGHWCNLGADTNTSNLKNNYSNVRLQLHPGRPEVDTGQLFCGLLMGDHSKAGINTMFNTGTVVGPGCSVFGGGYLPKSVPPFSWGGEAGNLTTHEIDRMLETERRVYARRGLTMSGEYEQMLRALAAQTV